MVIEKYYSRDGKVAVLHSSRYGAPWASRGPSWGDPETEMAHRLFKMFDKKLVEMKLAGAKQELAQKRIVEVLGDRGRADGWNHLQISWLEPGTMFYVDLDGGTETIIKETEFITA